MPGFRHILFPVTGHATLSQTGDYTVVQMKRQEELTRALEGVF